MNYITNHTVTVDALRKVMSSEVMIKHLREHWRYLKKPGIELTDCQLIRVFPKHGEIFVLQYELGILTPEGEMELPLYGQLENGCAKERCEKVIDCLKKSRRSQLQKNNVEDMVFCIPQLGLVLRRAGLDERLVGLKLFYQKELLLPVLRNFINLEKCNINNVSIQTLGHRLGKRCIARISYTEDADYAQGEQKSVIAKFYKTNGKQGFQVYQLMQDLCETGFNAGSHSTIPKPLAYDDQWKMLIMEDVPGQIISHFSNESTEAQLKLTGKTLAKLHQSNINAPGKYTVNDEVNLLKGWVLLVSQIFPEYCSLLNQALENISEALKKMHDFEPCLVHRDFYEKQILFRSHSATLIDFDTACLSDPAIDLGNFMGHIKLLRLQGINMSSNAERQFLAGYGDRFDEFNERIAVYERSTLLRLACLYAFWPQWKHLTNELITIINEI